MRIDLFKPVDNSPLVLFRMFFGLILTVEAWGAIATGWVRRAFIEPKHTFHFIGLDWLQPLPGDGMYAYYILMGIAGLGIMLGFYYRWAMGIYALMWAGVYFMQKTHYNNHYYLMVLLCAAMAFLPAHRYASYDVRRKPELHSRSCPQWCLWAFVVQMWIVYTYASIAKMYPDWLAAIPVKIWFQGKADYPVIGSLLATDWMPWLVSYGGIAFDLLAVPGLLWKPTRKYTFIIGIFFHIFNSIVFQVGVFPYMAILLCVFFFEPETIRTLFFQKRNFKIAGRLISIPEKQTWRPFDTREVHRPQWIPWLLGAYFLVQLLLPLRHHLYEGDVTWAEEGHRLSWRMMLRSKGGYVDFDIKDVRTGATWTVEKDSFLTAKQQIAVASRPDMCWQFVQILKKAYAQEGRDHLEIHARGKVSLNGRGYSLLYDPKKDLAKVTWQRFRHSEWLLPE